MGEIHSTFVQFLTCLLFKMYSCSCIIIDSDARKRYSHIFRARFLARGASFTHRNTMQIKIHITVKYFFEINSNIVRILVQCETCWVNISSGRAKALIFCLEFNNF